MRNRRAREGEGCGSSASAFFLLLAVWSLLLAGRGAAVWVGRENALLLSFGVAALLVGMIRPASRSLIPEPWRWGSLALLGLIAGYLSFTVCIAAIRALGPGLGLAHGIALSPGVADARVAMASVVLAPFFEELLYRERLLGALRNRLGAPLAVLLSSVLFALPHLQAWALVGTFLVGIFLGALMCIGGSVQLCIAVHAGLNLAALIYGFPPLRGALPAWAAFAGASGVLLAALWVATRETRGERVLNGRTADFRRSLL